MRFAKLAGALAACGMVAVPISAPFAAGEGGNDQTGVFTGRSMAAASGCPTADWHITRLPGNKLGGVVFWTDGSGISQASGNYDPNGAFTITLVSATGKGPTGTVTGSRTTRSITASMPGEGCNKISVNMKFDQPLDDKGGRG